MFAKTLPFVVFVINFIRLASFALDPSFFYNDDTSRSLQFSNSTAPLQILRVIRFSRALFEFNEVIFCIGATFSIGVFLLMISQMITVWSGKLGNRTVFMFLKLFDVIGPVFWPIFINVFILAFFLPASSASNIVYISFSAFSLVTLIFSIFQNIVLFVVVFQSFFFCVCVCVCVCVCGCFLTTFFLKTVQLIFVHL